MNLNNLILSDQAATLMLGNKLALACLKKIKQDRVPIVIYLQGSVGAGKTTLSRGFLNCLGFTGLVKSPTYTLVESYLLADVTVYHFDLYRLTDPEELEFIGIRDYVASACICLIEWPEKATDFLPKADVTVCLDYLANQRKACIGAGTLTGKNVLLTAQLLNDNDGLQQ